MDKSPEVRLSSTKEAKEEVKEFKVDPNPDENEQNNHKDSNEEDKEEIEEEERYFDLEKLKSIPSYASVLNNPKKSNFLAWIYKQTGEKMQPPELSQSPKISEFQDYIDKMQKSYRRYMKYHKKEESEAEHK